MAVTHGSHAAFVGELLSMCVIRGRKSRVPPTLSGVLCSEPCKSPYLSRGTLSTWLPVLALPIGDNYSSRPLPLPRRRKLYLLAYSAQPLRTLRLACSLLESFNTYPVACSSLISSAQPVGKAQAQWEAACCSVPTSSGIHHPWN